MSTQLPPATPSSPLNKSMHTAAAGANASGAFVSAPAAVTANAMNMAQNNTGSQQQHAHSMSYMNNSFSGSATTAAANPNCSPTPKAAHISSGSYQPQQQQQHHNIPATQSLPATTSSTPPAVTIQPAAVPLVAPPLADDKPQSNGTAEAKNDVTPQKENHVSASPSKNNTNSNNAVGSSEKHVEPVKQVIEPAEVPQVTAASKMTSMSTSVEKTPEKKSPAKEPSVTTPPPVSTASSLAQAACEKTPEKQAPANPAATKSPAVQPSPAKSEAKTKPSTSEAASASSTTPETKTPTAAVAGEQKNDDLMDTSDPVVVSPTTKPSTKSSTPEKEKKADETSRQEVHSTTADPQQKTKDANSTTTPVKSPMKLATTPRTPQRRSRTPRADAVDSSRSGSSKATVAEPKPSTSKSPGGSGGSKAKRARVPTQPYQSPLPELEIISKISQNTTTPKGNETRLIVFYKNEFLAVRNSEGGFFVCQAVQNVYKGSARIKIRWLSQDKGERSSEIYTPDFYDLIDFECILTNLALTKVDKGKFRLPPKEKERTDNILKRALAVERGDASALDDSMTEDNPDGLDVSLYTEEEQLTKKKASKRRMSRGRGDEDASISPRKMAKTKAAASSAKTPKKGGRKAPTTPATEPRKGTAGGRAERAKRRSAPEGTKSSTVIDNKKAKVLAKVVKRTATAKANETASPSSSITPKAKEVKPTKPKAATSTPASSSAKGKTSKATTSSPPPTATPSSTRKPLKRGRK